jgi:phage gp46-like protein
MVISIEQSTPDIRIRQNTQFPKYSVTCDWVLLSNGTLDDSQALATAVVVALGSNALADVDDVLPDPDSEDREGWWGDLQCAEIWDGWPLGSKLWLLRRTALYPPESLQGSTVAMIKNYIHDCIMPFVQQGIASTYEAAVVRVDRQRVDALIRLYRGPMTAVELKYQILWRDIQNADIPVDPYANRTT